MKPFIYSAWLLIMALVVRPAAAQTIPNGTFESWATRSTAEAPTGWLTQDDVLAAVYPGYTFNTGTVTKSTDAHGGSFAAKLTNISFGSGTSAVVLEGFMVLGQKLRGGNAFYEGYYIGGIPYTARPTQWQFYYKLTGPASDEAIATLLLTKNDPAGGLPLILGGGTLTLPPTTGGYQQVLVTIPYTSTAAPDSVRMQFSSGTGTTIAAGSVLLIDDVSLLGAPLAVRADAGTEAQLAVLPNPSPAGRFQLSAPNLPALASAPYTVLDLLGRVVAQQPALATPSPTRELDLTGLHAGIYILRLDSKQGTLTRQLVVK